MSLHIQGVHIADGFADDCDELIHRCLQAGTVTFEVFSEIWKEMEISSLYHGRTSNAEIAELSEEVLHIAKHYMVADTSNFEESVAGLFLVYGLLNTQPFSKFAALRIVQEDLPAIERIKLVARRDRRQDVLYVLGSVLIQGPVQYHAVVRERGMEYSIRKYLEGYTTIDKQGVRPKGIFYRQNTELDIIRELKNLTVRYTKAKENIEGVKPDDRNLNYLDANFANELDSSLKNIICGIIDDDDGDGDSSSSLDAIKNLKQKAMKATVKPIRHRMAVDMRAKSNQKEDSKSPPDKVKTVKNPEKKNKAKKRVRKPKSDSSDSDDYTIKADSDENTQDCLLSCDELDVTKFDQPNLTDIEQEISIEIDDLPGVIVNEIQGKTYEIEIIDHLNTPSTSDPGVTPTSDTDFAPEPDFKSEGENIKRIDKRDLKKTILKSRFKRMGMLPVANFENNK
ncbi:snRNA-activating protein complex subunit 1-like [Helicoverpa zea]|uniref:snRNA-activating protein complex subunit 1-like n=1 Tax=Helicoverpa zea TaxID=7113 RepID=UPI001F578189|nr:snRNA-activating protein complex subunit 1-like [Helicoverpa zea]XP_047035145.1 snRNA-activating protein complex subunit 1-like [Helicoverpa zea]